MIIFNKDESINLELETTISDGRKNREVDIYIYGYEQKEKFKIAIELKCYKSLASSGRKRGATNIFMKDIYEDLCKLEGY